MLVTFFARKEAWLTVYADRPTPRWSVSQKEQQASHSNLVSQCDVRAQSPSRFLKPARPVRVDFVPRSRRLIKANATHTTNDRVTKSYHIWRFQASHTCRQFRCISNSLGSSFSSWCRLNTWWTRSSCQDLCSYHWPSKHKSLGLVSRIVYVTTTLNCQPLDQVLHYKRSKYTRYPSFFFFFSKSKRWGSFVYSEWNIKYCVSHIQIYLLSTMQIS